SVSTASGPAPGYSVVMLTAWRSMAGSSSTPSRVQASSPKAIRAPVPISTISGRRIESVVSHMSLSVLPSVRSHGGDKVFAMRRNHVAVVEICHAAGSDELVTVQSAEDLGDAIVLEPELYGLQSCRIGVIDG